MIPIEIIMLIANVMMFGLVILAMLLLYRQGEDNAKRLMAKNLQEYEAAKHPAKDKPMAIYKDDETLYYENQLKQQKLQKNLQADLMALKREEESFQFSVDRSG